MSEHAKSRFEEREDLNILLGKREVGESSSQDNSLWMAHWTNCTQNQQGVISHSENTETGVAERLVIGMKHRSTTDSNLLCASSNENFDFYFNSVTQKAMVTSNIKSCEVLEGSDHFPMYGIKRKIESILNPQGIGLYDDRISKLNVTIHSSEEYQFQTQVQNPKNHRPMALGSCSCTGEGNLSTSSQIKCPSQQKAKTQSMNSAKSLSGSSKGKAVSLFEMVSLPTESYDVAQCRRKRKCCEENVKLDGMICNLKEDEGLFDKSDALLLENTKALESIGGLASSRAQKALTCRNSTRSNSTATACTGKSLARDKHIKSLPTTLDPGPSWTVTMDAIEILPQSSAKPKLDSNLMETQQKPSSSEAHSSQWLKRLKHDISNNASMLEPKRLKLEKSNSSPVSEQKVKTWMQRWCVKNLPSKVGEKFGVVPREAELGGRQFPSVAAMAMMGKAMNKFKPGEFQRRGPSVVWNDNGF